MVDEEEDEDEYDDDTNQLEETAEDVFNLEKL
jgi:hypothetical protein